MKKVKRKIVYLTIAEWKALSMIIGNGWADGDFEGYGGADPKIQYSAMGAFRKAKTKTISKPE